jgi:hypothetical protein
MRRHTGAVAAEPASGAPLDEVSETESAARMTERRMASEIYGLIIASSVLAAGADDDNILQVALSVLVTLVVYWLAEVYAHIMAARHVRGRVLHWSDAGRELRSGWPLVSASFVPLLVVVAAAVFGAGVSTAQTAGMLCATLLLLGSGWIAARRNDLTGFRLVLAALLAAGLGIALIGLKTILH